MKKLMYIAAALLVLVGCKKDNALNNAPEGTPFKKGQQVTLIIGTGNNANQVTPRMVAGKDNTETNQIDFTWEEGDQILVKVGDDATEIFTLISGEGTADGEFAGTMPADGSTFDIQHPIEAPDLNAQVYSSTQIDAKQMLFTATNCTVDNNVTLVPQYALLQLNLYSAEPKTVSKIMVSDISCLFDDSKDVSNATLTCPEGVTLSTSAETATPFYMIVPAGEYKFEVRVWDSSWLNAKIAWFGTSEKKNFISNNGKVQCLNMPAKEVKAEFKSVDFGEAGEWATVNAGGAVAPEDAGGFYYHGNQVPEGRVVSYLGGKASDAVAALGENWGLPSDNEVNKLSALSKKWTSDYLGTGQDGYIIRDITNEKYLFIPAAGYISEFYGETRDSHVGSYWVQNPDRQLYFEYGNFGVGTLRYDENMELNDYKRYRTIRPVVKTGAASGVFGDGVTTTVEMNIESIGVQVLNFTYSTSSEGFTMNYVHDGDGNTSVFADFFSVLKRDENKLVIQLNGSGDFLIFNFADDATTLTSILLGEGLMVSVSSCSLNGEDVSAYLPQE